jgi:pentapeptide MXKDX repeat protein
MNQEFPMKKIMIATAALALMCGSALAQNSTGPAPQSDNMQKPGMHNSKGSMTKETTGMNKGTNGMAKGGMQPDASGQGGSGPGSDQGGTRVSPGNMK